MQVYCDQGNSYGQKLMQSVDKIRVCEVTKRQKIVNIILTFIEDLMS